MNKKNLLQRYGNIKAQRTLKEPYVVQQSWMCRQAQEPLHLGCPITFDSRLLPSLSWTTMEVITLTSYLTFLNSFTTSDTWSHSTFIILLLLTSVKYVTQLPLKDKNYVLIFISTKSKSVQNSPKKVKMKR